MAFNVGGTLIAADFGHSGGEGLLDKGGPKASDLAGEAKVNGASNVLAGEKSTGALALGGRETGLLFDDDAAAFSVSGGAVALLL